MQLNRFKTLSGTVVAGMALSVSPLGAEAAITGPYTADADTLHLWHLDESSFPAADTGTGTTIDMSETDDGSGGVPALGAAGFTGFGTALDMGTTDHTDAVENTSAGLSQSAWQGTDGAFTYEALIRPNTIDAGSNDEDVMMIIGRDDGFSSGRAFQFRIFNGNLEFIPIGEGSGSVAIPTSGPHGFVQDEWFHVAVAYDGDPTGTDDLNFYWTRVDDSFTQANLLATTGDLSADIPTDSSNDTPSAIGSSISGVSAGAPSLEFNNLRGLIDEVRVSGVARGADEFIFVPEPASAALLGLGGVLLLSRRRA